MQDSDTLKSKGEKYSVSIKSWQKCNKPFFTGSFSEK